MNKTSVDILQALNPADYFTLAIDESIRHEQMPGNLCALGLTLNRQPDVAKLCASIIEFLQQFPLASASLQQRGQRFYWCQRTEPQQVFYQHHCPATQSETYFFQTTLEQIINQTATRADVAPIEFHLLSSSDRHIFVLRWFHPCCDALGAELILRYLSTDDTTQRALFDQPKTAPLLTMQLGKYRWWQNLQFFFQAYRYIRQLDQYQSIQHATLTNPPKRLRVLSFTLSEAESVQIVSHSRRLTGMTGTSLYYIGCLMLALHKLEPNAPGDAYLAPYAFNLRKQKALTPLFGNHLGTLFAQAPKSILTSRESLFAYLKAQHAQVIKQRLDYAFIPVMWAASYLSLSKHAQELRNSYQTGTERSSFWFSDVGQLNYPPHSFFEADINSVFHSCQITSPPGLALLMCKYRQQLTLSYNFVEPLFNEPWIKRLHQLMRAELLD